MAQKKTILPDPRRWPRFAGMCTFARYPLIESLPDPKAVDWAIYGYPFDSGTTYRPGTRLGPRAIRDASQYLKQYHIEHDVDVTEALSLADAGDSPVHLFSCKATLDATCDFAVEIGDPRRTRLMAIGGDHSLAYANIKATWLRRGKPKDGLALIHVDSHVDTLDQIDGESYSHASPFIRLFEEGIIDPKRMITIGVKGPLNSKADFEFAREHGVEMVTFGRWRREGYAPLQAFKDRLGGDETYFTFDVDAVDPAYAPGTGTPCLGGFTTPEAFEIIRSFAGLNIVGGDVVEVLPAMDVAEQTSLLAAHCAFEIICLDACRRVQPR